MDCSEYFKNYSYKFNILVNIMRKSLNCTEIYVMYALFRFSMRFF